MLGLNLVSQVIFGNRLDGLTTNASCLPGTPVGWRFGRCSMNSYSGDGEDRALRWRRQLKLDWALAF